MRRVWPFLWCIVAVAAACSRSRSWSPTVVEIASPAASRATAEPQITTFVGPAILSWIERSDDSATLKYSERTRNGWSDPITVASGTDWFLNWADVPSVVRVGDRDLAAHWLQSNGPDPEGYDLRLSFSHDNGRTWLAPVSPHHDATPTEHGFASMYPAPSGGLGLLWLDGRGGEAIAVRSTVFAADGSQQQETVVDDRVCECCPTAAAPTADGLIAAYRDRSRDEVRDIAVARFAHGAWTVPSIVHHDNWQIDACPVNGPAVASDGAKVAVAWFNAKSDQGHSFVAFSSDGGQTFGSPIPVDDASSLGRVDVAFVDDSAVVVAWLEYVAGHAEFRFRRVTTAGAKAGSTIVTSFASARANGYPRLARAGNELLLAWAESMEGVTRVRTATVQLQR